MNLPDEIIQQCTQIVVTKERLMFYWTFNTVSSETLMSLAKDLVPFTFIGVSVTKDNHEDEQLIIHFENIKK